MGYHQVAFTASCIHCDKRVGWYFDSNPGKPSQWQCDCGYINYLYPLPTTPELPDTLYIGPDRNRRFKVYPVPPTWSTSDWAAPFSIRSFVSQASERFGGCNYRCWPRSSIHGNPVYDDICDDGETWDNQEQEPCHVVTGWINGKTTCPLWSEMAKLCQTESERRFLHKYLELVKDRQFPMLIPQPWIGIADRRRPDFVAFVPLQRFRYRWVAIQLDAAHGEGQSDDDLARDMLVQHHGYKVISLRPTHTGYLEETRQLVEKFEAWMNTSRSDLFNIGSDVAVSRTEETMPF